MTRAVIIAFLLAAVSLDGVAQSFTSDFEKAKSLTLLESTQADLNRLFAADSGFRGSTSFSRENSYIEVDYAGAECTNPESKPHWGIRQTDWQATAGTAVVIRIRPKGRFGIKELGIDISNLKKEEVLEDHTIYHNKKNGIAIQLVGDIVELIELFPSYANRSSLCKSDEIQKFHSSSKWQRASRTKFLCRLLNWPADIVDLTLAEPDPSRPRILSVSAKVVDPENDIVTFNYNVSGGRIVGTGGKVIWDLTGVAPGEYSIIAGADDGIGLAGRYIKKTVVVD